MPPLHHLPNAPMYHESDIAHPSPFAAEVGLERGTIAAIVKMAKLWKTCFGVRRETEARVEKWKDGGCDLYSGCR